MSAPPLWCLSLWAARHRPRARVPAGAPRRPGACIVGRPGPPARRRTRPASTRRGWRRPSSRRCRRLRATSARSRALEGEHGPIRADSGRSSPAAFPRRRRAGRDRPGAFASRPRRRPPPSPRCGEHRRWAGGGEHPVAALRLAIEAEGGPASMGLWLHCTLANPGRERVRDSLLLDGARAAPRGPSVPRMEARGTPPAL